MLNPALEQVNQTRINQVLEPLKNILNQLQSVQNPQAFLQQALQSNPNMQRAIEYVNQHGGNEKAACYQMLQERGFDPETIMRSLFSNK